MAAVLSAVLEMRMSNMSQHSDAQDVAPELAPVYNRITAPNHAPANVGHVVAPIPNNGRVGVKPRHCCR